MTNLNHKLPYCNENNERFYVDDFFKYVSIKNNKGELIPLGSILKFVENLNIQY